MKRRKLPPGSRHHLDWCAVFRGGRCDCEDDDHRPPPRRRRPLPSGGAAERDKELENA
jgi:hypothetical protein